MASTRKSKAPKAAVQPPEGTTFKPKSRGGIHPSRNYSPLARAQMLAILDFHGGDSRAATDYLHRLGWSINDRTLRRWAKDPPEEVEAIRRDFVAQTRETMEDVLTMALRRVMLLLPYSDLEKTVKAIEVITDKYQLLADSPTQRVEHSHDYGAMLAHFNRTLQLTVPTGDGSGNHKGERREEVEIVIQPVDRRRITHRKSTPSLDVGHDGPDPAPGA
jgi:hypothetical protein